MSDYRNIVKIEDAHLLDGLKFKLNDKFLKGGTGERAVKGPYVIHINPNSDSVLVTYEFNGGGSTIYSKSDFVTFINHGLWVLLDLPEIPDMSFLYENIRKIIREEIKSFK